MLHRFKRADNGKEVFLEMTYAEWMDRIWSDGWSTRWCITLDDGAKAYDYGIVRKKSLQTAGNWPMASYAAGVSPDEVPELQKIDRLHGVKTEYTADGDPIFTSKSHRKKYCEVHKLFDRNAGYSDPLPARCR